MAEQAYKTVYGLPYVMVSPPFGSQKNNGYVGVPEGHPLYGKNYIDTVTISKSAIEELDKVRVNDLPVIPLMLHSIKDGSNDDADTVEISLALLIDVHGGLTYAASHAPHQEPDGYWWFGFDLLHYDSPEFDPGDRFCMDNIRLLAYQLSSFDPTKLSGAPAENAEIDSFKDESVALRRDSNRD